jgi:hypothetical protein
VIQCKHRRNGASGSAVGTPDLQVLNGNGPAGARRGRRGDRDQRPGDPTSGGLRQAATAARGGPPDTGCVGLRVPAAVGAAAGRSAPETAHLFELNCGMKKAAALRVWGNPANLPGSAQPQGRPPSPAHVSVEDARRCRAVSASSRGVRAPAGPKVGAHGCRRVPGWNRVVWHANQGRGAVRECTANLAVGQDEQRGWNRVRASLIIMGWGNRWTWRGCGA